jgi:hypothetical protein
LKWIGASIRGLMSAGTTRFPLVYIGPAMTAEEIAQEIESEL